MLLIKYALYIKFDKLCENNFLAFYSICLLKTYMYDCTNYHDPWQTNCHSLNIQIISLDKYFKRTINKYEKRNLNNEIIIMKKQTNKQKIVCTIVSSFSSG